MTSHQKLLSAISAVLFLLLGSASARAQLVTRHVVSLAEAQRLTAAGRTIAAERDRDIVVAVVDRNGDVILIERMDEADVGSVVIAQGKALTAARLKQPTRVAEEAINGGRPALATLFAGGVFVKGGLPIVVNGEVVGGIGCSGSNNSQIDEEICMAALEVLRTR